MGVMCHHAIVVTSWDEKRLAAAHEMAERMCPGLVSDIVEARINGGGSFFVAPDGSKEGWGESDLGDSQRDAFLGWLNCQRWGDGSSPFDWILVEYGERGPREGAHVVRSVYDVNVGDRYKGPCDLEETARAPR